MAINRKAILTISVGHHHPVILHNPHKPANLW